MSTVVVTGASRGIGLEFVNQLAASGHKVFACARNPDKSDRLQKLIDNKNVFAVKLDTTDEESIKNAVQEVSKNASEGVDILINNAGIGGESSKGPEHINKKDLFNIFETNVYGVAAVTEAFLPLLRQRGKEHTKKILNVSSILGSIQLINTISPDARTPAYNISKAALNMYVKMLSAKLADENFIVYSSHPGWVKTELGGDSAPVEINDSVTGQLAKLNELTAQDNGGYFDFEGKTLPW